MLDLGLQENLAGTINADKNSNGCLRLADTHSSRYSLLNRSNKIPIYTSAPIRKIARFITRANAAT
jgi:hypothetical protein